MITNEEVEKMYKDGFVKKFISPRDSNSVIYYYDNIEDEYKYRTKLNKIDWALSEWCEFWWDVKSFIEQETGNKKVVPIITLEDCYKYGL